MTTERQDDEEELPATAPVTLRLPTRLLAEIDARVEQLRRARDPGITRTIVMRELLKKGLES